VAHRQRESPQERCRAQGYPDALIACPDFVLSTLAVSVTELIEAAIAPVGLRMRHYRLVRMLWADGSQRQSAVGAALGIDRTSVVALIDELEDAGLVRRERDPDDRRSYCIVLTAKGRRVAEKAIARVSAAEASMFGPLSSAEKSALQNLATRLLGTPGPIADRHREEFLSLRDRSPASSRSATGTRGESR